MLFIEHEQKGGAKEDFPDFYKNRWEKILNHQRNKLEPR